MIATSGVSADPAGELLDQVTALNNSEITDLVTQKETSWIKKRRTHYSVFLKNSDLITNKIKNYNQTNLIRVQFFGYPFSKSIGIHSITEDYFEQEVNSVFCKNGEFVADGQTLGLLNFKKKLQVILFKVCQELKNY